VRFRGAVPGIRGKRTRVSDCDALIGNKPLQRRSKWIVGLDGVGIGRLLERV